MKILLYLFFAGFSAGSLQAQFSKTITTDLAGTLESKLTSSELNTITNITVKGKINELDFFTLRTKMPSLVTIDMRETSVIESQRNGRSYPANEIPRQALSGNGKIVTINLPSSATSIGESAFQNCSGLTSFADANSVTTIGREAFSGCKSLKSIIIPPLVSTIKYQAFYFCDSLTSVQLPATVNLIENGCFSHTANFLVDPDNTNYSGLDGILYNKNKTTLIQCPTSTSGNFNMIPTVETIGSDAFRQCAKITAIIFSPALDSIKDYAFIGCAGLSTLTFPPSLTYIGANAFYVCSDLKSVGLSASLEYIGENAFERCAMLDSIAIPSNVKIIGSWAFRYCTSLKSVQFSPSSQLTEIGDLAFNGCSGLLSVSFPNSVRKMGSATFQDCINLKEVKLPSSLTIIPYGLFIGCEKLAVVNIPASVTKIGNSAFMGCSFLPSVLLPKGIDTIDYRAFAGCIRLKSTNIPESVKFVGAEAYLNCKALIVLYVFPIAPIDLSLSDNVFGSVPKNTCRLMVPSVSKTIYKTKYQWKDFALVGDIDVLLSEINASAISVPAFHSMVFDYEFILPPGTSVPLITTNSLYPGASVKITQVASLPGTATIEVTGIDEQTKQTYTVYLAVADDGTNIITMKSATKAGSKLWMFINGTQGQVLVDYGDGNLKASVLTSLSVFNPVFSQFDGISPVDNPVIKIYAKSISHLVITAFNELTELDVSKDTTLLSLSCSDNHLTTLDVSKNIVLSRLDCNNNHLTRLELAGENNVLNNISCTGNLISACGLDSLYRSLPVRSTEKKGNLYITDNSGALTSNTQIALNKFWTTDITGDGSGCPVAGINTLPLAEFVLYPNPGNGKYFFNIQEGGLVHSIDIFDLQGHLIRSFDRFQAALSPNSLDLNDLAEGCYLLKCLTNIGVVTKVFIKN